MVFQSITRLAVPLTVAVHAFKKPSVYAGFINLNTDGHEGTRMFWLPNISALICVHLCQEILNYENGITQNFSV